MADNKPEMVADDIVVSMAYKLTVDGEIIDMTEDDDTIEFLQGHQNIIPGLEAELKGMKVGDSKQVTVSPEGGYGELDEEAIDQIPLSEFPEEVTPELDMELEMKDQEGNVMYGRIVSIDDETVTMDFNHPLAGQTLNFEVTIKDLRAPTGEELAHGHVHSHGHHH